jgi:hypothetical protein
LDEATIQIVTLYLGPSAKTHFAETESSDKRTTSGSDTDLAVEQRQRDELGLGVKHRLFRRHNNALQLGHG